MAARRKKPTKRNGMSDVRARGLVPKKAIKRRKKSEPRKRVSVPEANERIEARSLGWSEACGMDEVKARITRIPKVNKRLMLIVVGVHSARVRVREGHSFRVGDEIFVRYSGDRDIFEMVGRYDKRGRRV